MTTTPPNTLGLQVDHFPDHQPDVWYVQHWPGNGGMPMVVAKFFGDDAEQRAIEYVRLRQAAVESVASDGEIKRLRDRIETLTQRCESLHVDNEILRNNLETELLRKELHAMRAVPAPSSAMADGGPAARQPGMGLPVQMTPSDRDLISNAACAAQFRQLDPDSDELDEALYQAIVDNVCKPLRGILRDAAKTRDERDRTEAALRTLTSTVLEELANAADLTDRATYEALVVVRGAMHLSGLWSEQRPDVAKEATDG